MKITSLKQLDELYWLHDAEVLDIRYVHNPEKDSKDLLISCITGIENDPLELDNRRLVIRFDVADYVVGELIAYRPGLDQVDGVDPSKSSALQGLLQRIESAGGVAPPMSVAIWFVSGSQLDIACDSITITELKDE